MVRLRVAPTRRRAVARIATFDASESERVAFGRRDAAIGVADALRATRTTGKTAVRPDIAAIGVRAAHRADAALQIAGEVRPVAVVVGIDVTAAASEARVAPAVAHVAAAAAARGAARGAAMEGLVAVRCLTRALRVLVALDAGLPLASAIKSHLVADGAVAARARRAR